MEEGKLNSEKIWKTWKISKFKSKNMRKIWKKT
jgi:hypothetical protein